jgi:hypothetical protein
VVSSPVGRVRCALQLTTKGVAASLRLLSRGGCAIGLPRVGKSNDQTGFGCSDRAAVCRLRLGEPWNDGKHFDYIAPPGATAELSGLDNPTACVTPCVVVAKRSADITVTINKEGYEPQVIPLTKEIPGTGAAGFAGNVLVGGLVGMGVDAYTGAAQDHKPNPVNVTLQPLAPPPSPQAKKPRPPKRPVPQS